MIYNMLNDFVMTKTGRPQKKDKNSNKKKPIIYF